MDLSNIIPKLQEWAAFYSLKIVAAAAIFIGTNGDVRKKVNNSYAVGI
jgi:hypothetical protein